MLSNKGIITAFLISSIGHALFLGIFSIDIGTPLQDELNNNVMVSIEIEKPQLLPDIDKMGEEKKMKEEIAEGETKEVIKEDIAFLAEPERIEMIDAATEEMLRYQDMVKRRIERERSYPLWAKRQGIEGVVNINFTVLSNGTGRDIRVARSSGYKILDEEAVKNVKRANPFPPIPEKINKTSLQMNVLIVYTLK